MKTYLEDNASPCWSFCKLYSSFENTSFHWKWKLKMFKVKAKFIQFSSNLYREKMLVYSLKQLHLFNSFIYWMKYQRLNTHREIMHICLEAHRWRREGRAQSTSWWGWFRCWVSCLMRTPVPTHPAPNVFGILVDDHLCWFYFFIRRGCHWHRPA